jgi:protein-L-isoaspartate(D-aspartate) O-methyltransferase
MIRKIDLVDTLVQQGQRKRLIEELRKKGISSDLVLSAMNEIPRQWFFPRDFDQFVYRDAAFPIDHGQTISQPFTVAYQTQLSGVSAGDRVLEIGTGSGYQAAVLHKLGAQVFSVEYILPILQQTAHLFQLIEYNISLFHGDGSLGLPNFAPYDVIIVTAGAPSVPETLIQQLKVGGRLIIPVGENREDQKMLRITKIAENQSKTEVFNDCKFVPLKGKLGWQ